MIGFLGCLPFIIGIHIISISLMVKKRKLHKPKYVFLANLSTGDILLLLLTAVKFSTSDDRIYVEILRNICATSSILTTAAMTVEKYNAVEHCLRYCAIVTWQRVKCSVLVIWLASASWLFYLGSLNWQPMSPILMLTIGSHGVPCFLSPAFSFLYWHSGSDANETETKRTSENKTPSSVLHKSSSN